MQPWIILIVYVIALLAIDFLVLHKKTEVVFMKKASLETVQSNFRNCH